MFKKIWKNIKNYSRSYTDELLKNAVKDALFKARMESMLVLDGMQRESRLVLTINVLLLIFAVYFNEYLRISKMLAFTIYILLLIRLVIKITRLAIYLYQTRHTGFIYHFTRYMKNGGIFRHRIAFKATLFDLFALEYSSRLGKPIVLIHNGLSHLELTQSQEEIFEYFYRESVITFKKFFFSTLLLLIIEVLTYILITFLIRQWILTL